MPAEAKLRAIESAFDSISLLNPCGEFIYVNKAHVNLFGFDSSDEFLGKSWELIYTPDVFEKIKTEVLPILKKQGNWSGEIIGLSRSKHPVIQYVSITNLPDGSIICVSRDNSKAINTSRLEYLMNNLGKGIMVEDENHCLVLVNRQFCNLFCISVEPTELVGMKSFDVLQDSLPLFSDLEKAKEEIFGNRVREESIIGQEVIFTDGRIIERDYVPIVIENTFKGRLWSYMDVTQHKQLQKSLIDARNRAISSEKAKSAFLSNMSHEIRTPMHAILGLAEQLLISKLDEQQLFFVKNINDAAQGLLGVINDILDMTKIEAGKLSVERGVVCLKDINKSVENILRPKAKEKGIYFESDFDPKINLNLFADEIRIRQILFNIVGNAIKFTNTGVIKLTTKLVAQKALHEQRILFTCEDSGIGIAKEGLTHIFDEFYQGSNGSNHRHTGSGLGLAITKTLVNLMGGEIRLESIEDVGTKVMVEITFEVASTNELVKTETEYTDGSFVEGKKILIVEDNHINRMLFSLMVKNMKAFADEAENGLVALEKLEKNYYDVVLMDVQMPIMSGPDALVLIKKKYRENIPVIALTAAAFKSEVNHMLNLGFADCITKPIDQKTLLSRLSIFFKNGETKEKFYESIFKKVISNISEMTGNDPAQLVKMIKYLLVEVDYAIVEWEINIPMNDWASAKRILHREKVMINSIGVNEFDGLLNEIEDDSIKKSNSEMTLMFLQLLDYFQDLRKKLTS